MNTLNTECDIENSTINVHVRIRPMIKNSFQSFGLQSPVSPDPKGQGVSKYQSVLKVDKEQNILYVMDPEYRNIDKKEKPFIFNSILDDGCNNEQTFECTVKPNLENVLFGVNSTFFAYGITGSGKTHTIFGNQNDYGICLRAMQHLLQESERLDLQCRFSFSFLEIYNENVRDLLGDEQKNLCIMDDPTRGGVAVQELKEYSVTDIKKIEEYILLGNQKRAVASTAANQYSSRSHAILFLNIETKEAIDSGQIMSSRLTFIDLAGSEKVTADKQQKGIIEGSNINKSLLALGNCITILSQNKSKNTHVPYRDSKLTRILKDTLGGNTKTVMIACISQSYSCFDETINTLNYAQRATSIRKKVFRNLKEDNQIEIQQNIINTLRKELQDMQDKNSFLENSLKTQKLSQVTQDDQILQDNNYEDIDLQDQDYTSCQVKQLISEQLNKNLNIRKQDINEQRLQVESQIIFYEQKLIEIQNQEFSSNTNRSNQNEDFYIERIYYDIMANIEENLEIKQSLKEIEDKQKQYKQRLDQIQKQGQVTQALRMEWDELIRTVQDHNQIENRMNQTLEVNLSQREILRELLFKINQEKQYLQVEAQIKLLKHQLENLDLLLKNHTLIEEKNIASQSLTQQKIQIESQIYEIRGLNEIINQKEDQIRDMQNMLSDGQQTKILQPQLKLSDYQNNQKQFNNSIKTSQNSNSNSSTSFKLNRYMNPLKQSSSQKNQNQNSGNFKKINNIQNNFTLGKHRTESPSNWDQNKVNLNDINYLIIQENRLLDSQNIVYKQKSPHKNNGNSQSSTINTIQPQKNTTWSLNQDLIIQSQNTPSSYAPQTTIVLYPEQNKESKLFQQKKSEKTSSKKNSRSGDRYMQDDQQSCSPKPVQNISTRNFTENFYKQKVQENPQKVTIISTVDSKTQSMESEIQTQTIQVREKSLNEKKKQPLLDSCNPLEYNDLDSQPNSPPNYQKNPQNFMQNPYESPLNSHLQSFGNKFHDDKEIQLRDSIEQVPYMDSGVKNPLETESDEYDPSKVNFVGSPEITKTSKSLMAAGAFKKIEYL